jgi:hypothetical protein
MFSQTAWPFFSLGIGILFGIGLLGLFSPLSIPGRTIKEEAVILSILIILTGIYFFYKWDTSKEEIQELGQQVEQARNQYLTRHQIISETP